MEKAEKLKHLRDEMRKLVDAADPEEGHDSADCLLLRTCEALARGTRHRAVVEEIVAAWVDVEKWYGP